MPPSLSLGEGPYQRLDVIYFFLMFSHPSSSLNPTSLLRPLAVAFLSVSLLFQGGCSRRERGVEVNLDENCQAQKASFRTGDAIIAELRCHAQRLGENEQASN